MCEIVMLFVVADVVIEFIEGLVETYPGLQYLDGFPQVFILAFFTIQFWPCLLIPNGNGN